MQGRLSPKVSGKIQAFPGRALARGIFPAARAIGLGMMEWTLDQDGLRDKSVHDRGGTRRGAALSAPLTR